MIPGAYIANWRQFAPWRTLAQVEQDLVLSRALVELYKLPIVSEKLGFRGGTALNKLYLDTPARYSEDIDLVQIEEGAIGPIFDEIRRALDVWLGVPRRVQKKGTVVLIYRFEAEEPKGTPLRLKIEINSREHYSNYNPVKLNYRVDSEWFSGEATVTTYKLEELMGSKLRALYQRKKGRDLFDLWLVLTKCLVAKEDIISCFCRFMEFSGRKISRAQFEKNIIDKRTDSLFRADIEPLLGEDVAWDLEKAFELIINELVPLLPGEAWRGV